MSYERSESYVVTLLIVITQSIVHSHTHDVVCEPFYLADEMLTCV